MALHVTQQHLLDLAVEIERQDRGVEPLVLAGEPDLLVSNWTLFGATSPP
jgi:hypothetical protein